MSGFTYDTQKAYEMFFPQFFKSFPSTSVAAYAKNLVWDTHMLEQFARSYFSELRLNEPYIMPKVSSSNVPLAGMGAFKNRKIELTWIGHSQRNGEECALIRYEAFFNRFDMQLGVSSIDGLSHYWGLIWVSLTDKQLEHATLDEHVSVRSHRKNGGPSRHRVLRLATLTKATKGK